MKKTLCIIIAVLMAFSSVGCFVIGKPNDSDPTASPAETVTEAPTSAPTDAPTEAPTEAPTAVPTENPEAANEAFRALDLDVFRELVTSGMTEYNQYIVSDPAMFGIDPNDVEPGWGTVSYDEHVKSMNYYRDVLSRLEEIDFEKLNEMNKRGYTAMKRAFETELLFEDYYYYDEPLEPKNGLHTMLPLSMICFSVRNAEDVESYLYLIEDMARFLGEVGAFEEEKAERGLFMTETALDEVTDSCWFFAEEGEDCFLISYFDEEIIPKAKEFGYTDAQCEELSARNREAVLNSVLPAFDELGDTLAAHRDDCSEFVGAVDRGPEAYEYYKLKFRYEGATMDDMDTVVDYLESMGETVYYDLMIAVYAISFSPNSEELFDKLEEPITFGSVDENLEWLGSFIEKYYPELPDYDLRYIDVPNAIADDFSPAAYLTPGFDDFYDNLMLLNPTSEDAEDLLTIAHETIPGHLFQFLYTRSTEGMCLTQQILEPTGYAEAWTKFTEYFVANNCDDLNTAICSLVDANMTYSNVFLPAIISAMVNYEGADLDEVEEYLDELGMAEYADVFYEYAITMPFYAVPYAVGYAYMRDIYETANPMGQIGHKQFFEKYLSFGPNYMDIMLDYIEK